MARPSKFTPEVEAAIVDALTAGMSRRGAAEHAGIDVRTLERWMRRFVGFAASVTRAEATVELSAVQAIKAAWENGDWRAGQAWLERRRNDEWGKRDRIEIEIRRAAEQIAQQTGADPDWLVKRAVEIAAAAAKD